MLLAVLSPKAKEKKLWAVLMDDETTVGCGHHSWVPDHLCQALQDQCCSQAAEMGPVSTPGLSACLTSVCVIRDSVQCAEAACDHWHALDSLPYPGLFPRMQGQLYTYVGSVSALL